MLKREAKKVVVDRGRSKYCPAEYHVLLALIAATRMRDTKTEQVEDCQCDSKLARLAKVTGYSERTVISALKVLEKDNHITVHREGVRHSYTVHVERMKSLPYYKESILDKEEASRERSAEYREGLRKGAELASLIMLPVTIERLRNGNQKPSRFLLDSKVECAKASYAAVTALMQRNSTEACSTELM